MNYAEDGIVGCYSLHLYCRYENKLHDFQEFPHEFTAEFGSEARQDARKFGWKLNLKKNRAVCPKCTSRGLK